MNPYFFATATICIASNAFAAQTDSSTTHKKFETLTVTATRTAQTADETLASVTIITREQIERMQATDLTDILRIVPGIEIVRSGGQGQLTSIFTRGTESDHTLVLIDGMKMNPGTLGSANISYIHPDNIERIEVVKGPRSTLYGSEAIGGVIQIFTRQKGPAFSARATIGSNSTKEAGIQTFHNTESGTKFGFSLNSSNTKGFPTYKRSSIDTGHDNMNARIFFAHNIGNTDIKASVLHSKGNTEYLAENYSNFPTISLEKQDQDFTQQALNLDINTQITDSWLSLLKFGLFNDELDQNQSSDFAHTKRTQLDWQHDYETGDHALTAGISIQREAIESLSFGSGFDETLDTAAIYLQDNIQIGLSRILLAARFTDHETFGDNTTWEASYGYQATPTLNLYASAATAFRAPSASDLYGYGGNINLQPETSKTYEIGAKYQLNPANHISAAVFYNQIEDLINFVEIAPFTYQGRNIDKVLIQGVELSHQLVLDNWDWNTSVVIQSPHNEITDSTLLRRAHRTLNSSISYRVGKYRLGANLIAQSRKKDTPSDVAGYGIVNVSASKQITPTLTLEGKLLNLTDKEYEQVSGYNTQGRAGFVTLKMAL
ncbi:TonB-dependent receptor [Neptunomonas sp.]|uniref:TonB-dependent receptor domain-containing protein n=1 Tax=Neptunomonas sp. TaxID=1971898 RepID=UPI0025FE441E|nr:TonB-dependent receptor [Neptunomonas sp.]